MNGQFTGEEIQKSIKPEKGCSKSLVVREMNIETAMNYQFIRLARN